MEDFLGCRVSPSKTRVLLAFFPRHSRALPASSFWLLALLAYRSQLSLWPPPVFLHWQILGAVVIFRFIFVSNFHFRFPFLPSISFPFPAFPACCLMQLANINSDTPCLLSLFVTRWSLKATQSTVVLLSSWARSLSHAWQCCKQDIYEPQVVLSQPFVQLPILVPVYCLRPVSHSLFASIISASMIVNWQQHGAHIS